MAGHSQFKNIMHRKGAQDAKRAKVFTKILREITVAAKSGGVDPVSNPRLRNALIQARTANMPKDNVERAIAKANESAESYETLRWEAIGPGGSALMIDVLTDNRNRITSEIRMVLNKNGGRQADVAFLFHHCGLIHYDNAVDKDALMEAALQTQADDIKEHEDGVDVVCEKERFFAVKEALEVCCGPANQAFLAWVPLTPHDMTEDHRSALERLVDALEDMDDVQRVWTNV